MSGSWILSAILILPLLGATFILLLPRETEATRRNARWIALFATLLTFALSLVAFVLGIDNRFTVDGIFNVPPNVDWLPPLSAQQWYQSFAQHQQDPVFAACGGSQPREGA